MNQVEPGTGLHATITTPRTPSRRWVVPILAAIHGSGPRISGREGAARRRCVYSTLESPQGAGPSTLRSSRPLSAPDTDFVARLVDVHPDGRAICAADGILRASARETYPAPGVVRPVAPSPIEPGEIYEYVIDLWATGITFLPGHKIRVEITSSSHPAGSATSTRASALESSRTKVAHQTIFHDASDLSRITLTVIGVEG